MEKKLADYLDENGVVKSYPSNKNIRMEILNYVTDRFKTDRRYTEPDVNEILKQSLGFSDYELIRRELYQYKFIDRQRDGSAYWVDEKRPVIKNQTRLVMFEGLPGSGKTTAATLFTGWLQEESIQAHLFKEGEMHPADMAWCACMTEEELKNITDKFPAYSEMIEKVMSRQKIQGQVYCIVPYITFDIKQEDQELFHIFESFEIYDGRKDIEFFMQVHRQRWERFANRSMTKDELNIFECSFLQNNINEMILFGCKNENDIERYLRSIVKYIKQLNPVLIYMEHSKPIEQMRRVADERIDGVSGERSWEKFVASYIEKSPFGQKKGYAGTEGMYQYFAYRYEVEHRLLQKLDDKIQIHVINNDDYRKAEEKLKDIVHNGQYI